VKKQLGEKFYGDRVVYVSAGDIDISIYDI